MKKIYLDNAATTPVHPQVLERMRQSYALQYANPSSMYDLGIANEKEIEKVRALIAKTLGGDPREVYFTSGGTEGDNTIIKGAVEIKRPDVVKRARLITTTIEHPAVKEVFDMYEEHGIDVVRLPVDSRGRVDAAVLEEKMSADTILVSIIGVNNEIGTIQDLYGLGKIIKAKNPQCVFHTDYVQGYMKVPLNVRKCRLDAVTLCGHKINGPKGIGAIYLRKGLRIKPLMLGGGQEQGLRSGTENIQGIIGFGEAVCLMDAGGQPLYERMAEVRRTFIDGLAGIEDMRINGDPEGSPYVLSVSFKGLRGEVLLHSLEKRGVYISTGSACSTHKKEKQAVLKAIGLPGDDAEGTIRVSFSMLTTKEEAAEGAAIVAEEVQRLRSWLQRKKH